MRLEVRDLSCGYHKQHPVVKNISFELFSGDICALLGPNGVGKTTLFKTILNIIKPLSGAVSIDGEEITDWKPRKLSHYMAYVAQAHIPSFPYQVKDIVMMGRMGQMSLVSRPSKHDLEITEQAMEDVGIRHLREAAYSEISGGERQLLMIAKALAQQPQVLLMDEPTANLDYGNMVLVMRCMRQLADQGICVIFTTHMPDQALWCRAKTLMLFRNAPLVFGEANIVINKRNLEKAYQSEIRVLEVMDEKGKPYRMCVPEG